MSSSSVVRSVTNMTTAPEMSSSSPKSVKNDQFSVFGESSCGEPLVPQRLLIDFTPNDEDNDFVQRKICTFWKFINNTPEIQNLMALPERETSNVRASSPDYQLPETSPSRTKLVSPKIDAPSDVTIDLEGTAVSKLEFVEEKGLINRVFEAKIVRSGCSLGSREYKEKARSPSQKKKKQLCKCTTVCDVCYGVPSGDSPVKKLCKQMEDWDAKHHKSTTSPGHPPPLVHSVLQRQVFPDA